VKSAESVVEVHDSLTPFAAHEWNRLAGDDPLLRHEFLHALHETGCASARTGWAPQFLVLREQGELAGAMPLYLKTHSYGEYVFDWAWADAYQRHGLAYYPKLLSAIPFTPVMGRRMLAGTARQRNLLANAALELARATRVSSLHCLYPVIEQADELRECGMTLRQGVQFHWRNDNYAEFGAFLATFNHAKRKKIKQERRRVRDAGIAFEWFPGPAITDALWVFFNRCYRETYRQHHSTPYLNLDFFRALGRGMPENLVLIVAQRDGYPIAASLNVHNGTRLCGRYWGALEEVPFLHFELCYYQAIEWAIANGLTYVQAGAQGEHKLARGYEPAVTKSAHFIVDPGFREAVGQFLDEERRAIAAEIEWLRRDLPYRQASSSSA